MPDMNENAETQQEYFGKIRTDNTRTLHNALNKIAALEEKISILLSCKNCPENKGGLLCQKEYEDKCLAQKIQYIKELQEENAELKEMYHESDEDNNKLRENIPKLAEAKEIIKTFLAIVNNDVEYVQNPQECKDLWKELCENAETFLKE